ncbi:MAG: hypothetical protein KKB25_02470 [Nanoarchaeota archaeon]|nr:hypothetical protein [Nanoarchaeota archaeon]
MVDGQTMIIFDDTSIGMIRSPDDKEYNLIEPALNYIIFYKKSLTAETSSKVWEEKVEEIKGTETYEYIRAVMKPSNISSLQGQDITQSIIDLINAYAKIYENVFLISNRDYEEFNNHQSVFPFTPEEFCDFINEDKAFKEHLESLQKRIDEKKCREAE